jgi:hypothetical protein
LYTIGTPNGGCVSARPWIWSLTFI